MTPSEQAEALVSQFGISDPRDIDIEAIALDAGVEIEYEPLVGCEAVLVGFGDRAIATVKPSKIRGRERFSIAHELGHWNLHRGKSFRCRVNDPDENLSSNSIHEKEADTFAAHLLMPAPLFQPAVKALGNPGFRELEKLAEEFSTSLLATSVRLADINTLPVILACYASTGRRWYKAASDVPKRWWLRDKLDDDSFAYDLLAKGKQPCGVKQSAEVWFENYDADDYEVLEYCISSRSGEVLVLIYLTSKMLYAKFDPGVGNRKYNEFGSYVPKKVR